MQTNPGASRSALLGGVPGGVSEVVRALAAGGHAAYLVGGCVRDLLRGERVGDFDVTTSASPETVLAILPRAIPIGLRHGTVMVPTRDGPVDVTRFRAGPDLAADLSRRDFTINAIALDIDTQDVHDPFGGRKDLEARCLRAVGSAAERFREDPLRILRAARLVAALDLTPTPDVESAMAAEAKGLRGVARERIRCEIERTLLAPHAARGLDLLRRTGVEGELFPGAPPDAVAVVAALPPDLGLRLAGWLRGTPAELLLRRLRFPRRTAQRVAHLLRHHPIGEGVNPKREALVRKLLKRVGIEELEALYALREAEIAALSDPEAAAAQSAALRGFQAGVARVRRAGALALGRCDLALSGHDVMQALGTGPGRAVGQALRHLTERVIEDPSLNTPEKLHELLERWRAEQSGAER